MGSAANQSEIRRRHSSNQAPFEEAPPDEVCAVILEECPSSLAAIASVASNNSDCIPLSKPEWPASLTILSSISGHIRCSSHAVAGGQTRSLAPCTATVGMCLYRGSASTRTDPPLPLSRKTQLAL